MSYTPLSTKLGVDKEGRFHSELHTSWYQAGCGQGGEVSQLVTYLLVPSWVWARRGGFTVSYTPLGTKLGVGKEGRFHSELHTSWYQAGCGQGGEVSQCELHTSWYQAGCGQGGEVSQCELHTSWYQAGCGQGGEVSQ